MKRCIRFTRDRSGKLEYKGFSKLITDSSQDEYYVVRNNERNHYYDLEYMSQSIRKKLIADSYFLNEEEIDDKTIADMIICRVWETIDADKLTNKQWERDIYEYVNATSIWSYPKNYFN